MYLPKPRSKDPQLRMKKISFLQNLNDLKWIFVCPPVHDPAIPSIQSPPVLVSKARGFAGSIPCGFLFLLLPPLFSSSISRQPQRRQPHQNNANEDNKISIKIFLKLVLNFLNLSMVPVDWKNCHFLCLEWDQCS